CNVRKSYCIFAARAGIAQLVEHNLAKVGVASSSLVSRSVKPLKRKFERLFIYIDSFLINDGITYFFRQPPNFLLIAFFCFKSVRELFVQSQVLRFATYIGK